MAISSYTAILVDDEAPMRDHLRHRLKQLWPELEIVAEANNAQNALDLVQQFQPQIVFLDIRMPGQSGIEIAEKLAVHSLIVFVTAYDEYALKAFEEGAIDYVLKPIDRDRLEQTCRRIKHNLSIKNSSNNMSKQHVKDILKGLVSQQLNQDKKYLRWIQASVGSDLRLISTQEILYFRADEKYTCVKTEHVEYLIRKSLKELEDALDPREFWRIHRSTLVKITAISRVRRDGSRLFVEVRHCDEKLEVSRNHTHLFQSM